MVRSLGFLFTLFSLCHCGKQITRPHEAGDSASAYLVASTNGSDPFDVNGDGKLDIRDLTDLAKRVRARVYRYDSAYDVNKDGKVSAHDIAPLAREINRRAREATNTNPENAYDANNDGKVTLEDALCITRYLRRGKQGDVIFFDVNADHVIDEEDAKAVIRHLRRDLNG